MERYPSGTGFTAGAIAASFKKALPEQGIKVLLAEM
jgi:hypothetical protein